MVMNDQIRKEIESGIKWDISDVVCLQQET